VHAELITSVNQLQAYQVLSKSTRTNTTFKSGYIYTTQHKN